MQSDLLVWIGPPALDPPAGLGREGGRGYRVTVGDFKPEWEDSDSDEDEI